MKPTAIVIVIALAAFVWSHSPASGLAASSSAPAPLLQRASWTIGLEQQSFRRDDRDGIGDRDPADRRRRG